MKAALAIFAISGAQAFAPSQPLRTSVAVNGYVPEGLSAAEWNQRQANEKRGKVENKKKYPKGAPQVVGVGKYLENLAKKQTFKKNSVGNAKVEASGHAFAKVKFGEFTKEGYDAWRKKGGKPPNMEGRSANLWR